MSDPTGEGEGPTCNIEFTIVYKKDKLLQNLAPSLTIGELKKILEPIINVPFLMQKMILKGILTDEKRLSDLNLTKSSKIMVIGSTIIDAESVKKTEAQINAESSGIEESKDIVETLADKKEHQIVIERHGKPDDAMVGISNRHDPLPPDLCLTGMYDRRGQKIRIKVNLDRLELVLATRDRTQKVPLVSIEEFVHCPMTNHLGYELVAFQLGPTEKSRFFVYWFPSQYVEALQDIIMQYKIFSDK